MISDPVSLAIVRRLSPVVLLLVAEVAEPLAEYMLSDYAAEDWQDSPVVEGHRHGNTA